MMDFDDLTAKCKAAKGTQEVLENLVEEKNRMPGHGMSDGNKNEFNSAIQKSNVNEARNETQHQKFVLGVGWPSQSKGTDPVSFASDKSSEILPDIECSKSLTSSSNSTLLSPAENTNLKRNIFERLANSSNVTRSAVINTGESSQNPNDAASSFALNTNPVVNEKSNKSNTVDPLISRAKKYFAKNSIEAFVTLEESEERPFICKYCEKTFAKPYNLNLHLRTHTKVKPYQCSVCSKAFTQSSALKMHLRFHTKDNLLQCQFCGKMFTRDLHLTEHHRVHTKERPFECNVCKKMYSRRSTLKVHLRTHSKEKPYRCEVCNKVFSQKGSLKVHFLRFHGDEEKKPVKLVVKEHFLGDLIKPGS